MAGAVAGGVTSRVGFKMISGGFFHCGHCNHVVEPSEQQIAAAENAPAGSLLKLKCPRCHKHEVGWRPPIVKAWKKPEPVPMSLERGLELFAELKQALSV
jgi:phage FluMu protein Com